MSLHGRAYYLTHGIAIAAIPVPAIKRAVGLKEMTPATIATRVPIQSTGVFAVQQWLSSTAVWVNAGL